MIQTLDVENFVKETSIAIFEFHTRVFYIYIKTYKNLGHSVQLRSSLLTMSLSDHYAALLALNFFNAKWKCRYPSWTRLVHGMHDAFDVSDWPRRRL